MTKKENTHLEACLKGIFRLAPIAKINLNTAMVNNTAVQCCLVKQKKVEMVDMMNRKTNKARTAGVVMRRELTVKVVLK